MSSSPGWTLDNGTSVPTWPLLAFCPAIAVHSGLIGADKDEEYLWAKVTELFWQGEVANGFYVAASVVLVRVRIEPLPNIDRDACRRQNLLRNCCVCAPGFGGAYEGDGEDDDGLDGVTVWTVIAREEIINGDECGGILAPGS